MDRWTPYSTQSRHRRNVNISIPIQAPGQPDYQSTVSDISLATIGDSCDQISQRRPESPSHHSYPSINAAGNANLILGNVHEVHYHVPPPLVNDREKLLSSLHFREMFMRYENIDDAHSDTFGWILQPPKDQKQEYRAFSDWIHGDENLFWVSGKPGSGKSVLMKYLTQNLEQSLDYSKAATVVLSFWFWEAAHQNLERSFLGCLRSLLWQALHVQSHSHIIVEAVGHNVPFEWTERRLRDALNAALKVLERSESQVFLFLDGLDESGSDASQLLSFVRDLSKTFPRIRICVSSRPEPVFQQSLAGQPHLTMQNLNRPDVQTIIQQDLLKAPEFVSFAEYNDELRLLEREILKEAQGVLLWVRIVVKDLLTHAANGDTLAELTAHLHRLPAKLEGDRGLFAFMLKRNARYSKNYLAEAALYLQIACKGQTSVLRYRLATDDSLRQRYLKFHNEWETLHNRLNCDRLAMAISARTGGLLEVGGPPTFSSHHRRVTQTRCSLLTRILNIEDGRYVQFVHRTARSFILETKTGQDLLDVFSGKSSDIDRILFEADLIAAVQLPCLESVAPMSFSRILIDRSPPDDSQGDLFRETVETLAARGYVWTEPYHARWLAITGAQWEDLPLPLLKEGESDISFAHVYALNGWIALTADEYQQVHLTEHLDHYRFSVLNAVLSRWASDINLVTGVCNSILSHGLDPDCKLVNTFGERVSAYNSVVSQYDSYSCVRHLQIDVFAEWRERISHDARSFKYSPTMAQCSSLFFHLVHSEACILATSCSEEAALFRQLASCNTTLTERDKAVAQLAPFMQIGDTRILSTQRPGRSIIPQMYSLTAEEYRNVLPHFFPFSLHLLKPRIGIIDAPTHAMGFKVEAWIEIASKQLPKISLLEAFRLLGKSEASIEAFIAVEEPRIRLAYEPAMYQAWRAWLYGTEEETSPQV